MAWMAAAIFSLSSAQLQHQASAQGASAQAAEAQRIISIGGDVTEIIYALGVSDRVVAVDSSSQFPPEALRDKKSVGYMRTLAPEGVLSVGADLIVASDRAGPADIVQVLKTAGRYVEVPEGNSPEGVMQKIKAVAKAVGKVEEGDALARSVEDDFAALRRDRKAVTKPLRALFILNVVNGRATVGGSGTSADAILKLAAIDNAAASITGFKPVGDEALIEMRPDIVVTMKRVAGAGHDAAQIWSLAGLQKTPAAADRRMVEMDGQYLLGFGPRVASAARDLMRAAYPMGPATSATR